MNGIRLPTGYYFGLSAATGDLSDAHDIISVKTYDLVPLEGDEVMFEGVIVLLTEVYLIGVG